MAAIWKGHISFGLVNIPISLHTAETKDEISFHMLDRRNGSRVRNKRVNEDTGEEVPWNEIVKGYELEKDRYVVLEKEDFERARIESTKSIEIQQFVDESELQFPYYEKPYIVVPSKKAEKGYVILREAMKRMKKVGIAKVVIGMREHVAALIPFGNSLMLELLRYGEELKSSGEFSFPGEDPSAYKITDKEIDLAGMLIENLAGSWDPEEYKDEYRESLLRAVEQKAAGGEIAAPETGEKAQEPGKVLDMMELLKRSVEQSSRQPRKQQRKREKPEKRPVRKVAGD